MKVCSECGYDKKVYTYPGGKNYCYQCANEHLTTGGKYYGKKVK